MRPALSEPSHFRCFKTSPKVICLALIISIRFPLSPRDVEDLLHERRIEFSQATVRIEWNRFAPIFAAEIHRRRVNRMRCGQHLRWPLDEIFVKISGLTYDLWRAVDNEGEALERTVANARDREAGFNFLKKSMKRHGQKQS